MVPAPTIRVFADPWADKASLRRAIATILHSGTALGADIRVRLFDTQAEDWVPPKPLSMRDYSASLVRIIKGQQEREREKESAQRLDAAVASFDEYLRKGLPTAAKCTKLLNVAEEIAAGSEWTTILVLGENICTTPRIRLQLPADRQLVIMLAHATDLDNALGDCALLQNQRRLHAWFPQATIVPVLSLESLVHVVAKGSGSMGSNRLVVDPCSVSTARRAQSREPVLLRAVTGLDEGEPAPGPSMRLIAPRPHAHVARIVPFQGDGAIPGETILAVVQVGQEYWPTTVVIAEQHGTFSGEAIAGRPFADCNVKFVLRVFRNVRQKVLVGQPLPGWPAGDGTLPVEVVRTEDCGASM
jgi:hypothetical protein